MTRRKSYLIGIDVGGTKVLTGLLNSNFEILSTKKNKVDPHKGEKAFFKSLEESILSVCDDAEIKSGQIKAIGVGCPGMILNPKGIVTLSPNISFMKNYPFREKLMRRFKVPVIVENDVNAGLYGEFQFGAAKGFQNVAGIFLGTGVGGALVLNGEIYRGSSGAAGEIGHTFLSIPSFLPGTEREGTLEGMIGRLRVASDAGYLMMKQQAPHLYESVGFDVKKIKSKALTRSIEGGDEAVLNLIYNKARLLGIAMANVVNLLNPEVIVLGGGLMEAMEKKILPVAREVMKALAMPPIVKNVRVVPAKLQDYAIVKGAAKLVVDSLKK